ncbi:hypothetical protein IQ218_09320 [Synechocystis salina LEGE 06099]|uniref:hypothetical protein n=1 Tax=Synechocystis salina TaxID=945780 RepID=UPI001880FD92|nr:hypothetical protein [Synechocystis salina]MBE9203610.1 hypothetical protein [Synechocystis salina LEGE 06099]
MNYLSNVFSSLLNVLSDPLSLTILIVAFIGASIEFISVKYWDGQKLQYWRQTINFLQQAKSNNIKEPNNDNVKKLLVRYFNEVDAEFIPKQKKIILSSALILVSLVRQFLKASSTSFQPYLLLWGF